MGAAYSFRGVSIVNMTGARWGGKYWRGTGHRQALAAAVLRTTS